MLSKDEIIQLANGCFIVGTDGQIHSNQHMILTFANLIAASEREACAKVCDAICDEHWQKFKGHKPLEPMNEHRGDVHTEGVSDGASDCAAAIRARSNT